MGRGGGWLILVRGQVINSAVSSAILAPQDSHILKDVDVPSDGPLFQAASLADRGDGRITLTLVIRLVAQGQADHLRVYRDIHIPNLGHEFYTHRFSSLISSETLRITAISASTSSRSMST